MTGQWIKAQAIMTAAYGARAFASGGGKAFGFCNRARMRLPVLLTEWGWEEDERMRALPPSTLHMLAAMSNDHLTRPFRECLQARARDALADLTPNRESPLAAATALVHCVMHGTGGATRITRFGSSLFKSSNWRQVENRSLPELEEVLRRLRSAGGTTEDRRADVDTLM